MSEFLQYQDQTSQYYTDLMDKLDRMNGTLGFMLRLLDRMQGAIEERLHTIQGYLGWAGQWTRRRSLLLRHQLKMFVTLTGLSLTAMWTCVAHTGYFLLGAVLLTFLRCSWFSRALLLLVVPMNAAAEVNQQPAMDLTGLSVLLLAASLGTDGRLKKKKKI